MTTTSIRSSPAPTADVTAASEGRDWSRYTQQLGIVVVIAVLCAVFQSRNSVFLGKDNIIEVLRSGTLFFIVACR